MHCYCPDTIVHSATSLENIYPYTIHLHIYFALIFPSVVWLLVILDRLKIPGPCILYILHTCILWQIRKMSGMVITCIELYCSCSSHSAIYLLPAFTNVVCRKISPELGQKLIKTLQHALCHCIYFSWSLSNLDCTTFYRLTCSTCYTFC